MINVSRGSGVSFMKEFCEDNYGDQAEIYMKRVQDSCIEVAKAVQNEFDFEIDALGLDYCLTEKGELFLYEVNAFPGSRPHDALVEFHAVQFAMYLYKKIKIYYQVSLMNQGCRKTAFLVYLDLVHYESHIKRMCQINIPAYGSWHFLLEGRGKQTGVRYPFFFNKNTGDRYIVL